MFANGAISSKVYRTYTTPGNAHKALDKFAAEYGLTIDDGGHLADPNYHDHATHPNAWSVRWLIAAVDTGSGADQPRFAPVVVWNATMGKNINPLFFAHNYITVIS